MPIVQDTLWKHPGHPGMIVVTAHASIGRGGRLIMSTGEAQEAARRITGIEEQCAELISRNARAGVYGFIPVRPSRPEENALGFGIFQTRKDLHEPADPELIRLSLECMNQFVSQHPQIKIRMNYPGIGEEGLDPQVVAPMLDSVPSSVTICHNGEVSLRDAVGFNSAKDLFVLVARWIQEGRQNIAIDFLVDSGFSQEEAANQVAAVRRAINERSEHYARLAARRASQRLEQTHFDF